MRSLLGGTLNGTTTWEAFRPSRPQHRRLRTSTRAPVLLETSSVVRARNLLQLYTTKIMTPEEFVDYCREQTPSVG